MQQILLNFVLGDDGDEKFETSPKYDSALVQNKRDDGNKPRVVRNKREYNGNSRKMENETRELGFPLSKKITTSLRESLRNNSQISEVKQR